MAVGEPMDGCRTAIGWRYNSIRTAVDCVSIVSRQSVLPIYPCISDSCTRARAHIIKVCLQASVSACPAVGVFARFWCCFCPFFCAFPPVRFSP